MSDSPEVDEIELDGQDQLDSSDIDGQDLADIEVRISKDQFSVFELLRNIDRKKLIIAPEFQRHDVWKDTQRSELIESILMNIPIPLIYLFEDKKGIKQVVDGRQRLTSLRRFVNNEFKLTNLKVKVDLNGNYFNSLSPELQAKIEDYQINAYVIQPPTPETIKFNIFDRVNRAGTQLNKQEMRHALYQGKASRLLEKLSKKPEFKQATGSSLKPERMRDRYAILRFISFYLLNTKQLGDYKYRSNIDDFMAYVMEFINTDAAGSLLESIETVFTKSMKNNYNILGKDAFRFNNLFGTRRPINVGLFEMLAFAFQDDLPLNSSNEKIKQEVNKIKSHTDALGVFDKGASTKHSMEYRYTEAESLREKIQIL